MLYVKNKMYQKIKNNHLYNFIFRIILILFISSFIWIFLIKYYYEEQISTKLQEEMNTHKQKIKLLLNKNYLNSEKKVKQFDSFKEEVKKIDKKKEVEYLIFYDDKKSIISKYEKEDSFKEIKTLINNFNKLTLKTKHSLIPYSKEKGYLFHQSFIKIDNKKIYYKILVKLNKETLNKIKKDISDTLIIIAITIFIVFISIFPLIYTQYKSMLKKQKELIQSNINTLKSLGNAIAKRDSDTSEHNYRVTYYSIKIAQELGLSKNKIKSLIKGAFLHDIGKIAISDNILLKPSKLTDEEFEIMKTHVNSGVDIVKDDPWLSDAINVILNHHEKVDGTGYPNNLKYKDIPIEARIFAVADVFDALTSKRPYKEAYSVEKSFEIIKNGSSSHFDQNIVKIFENIYFKIYNNISNKNKKELEKIFNDILKPYFY